ncbi:hypothetical protein FKM82_027103, partial [Ascaphus truei]
GPVRGRQVWGRTALGWPFKGGGGGGGGQLYYTVLQVSGVRMARDCTESRFLEVLARFGGPERVLLVGELWDRAESRALLTGFLQELFPGDRGGERPDREDGTGIPRPDRTLRFPLIFFLCRAESVRLPGRRRDVLREILRDVRDRTPGGAAVTGVIVQPGPGDPGEAVATLRSLLHSVFPPERRSAAVRVAALTFGQEEDRRQVQRAACEAVEAADGQSRQKPRAVLQCFPWRRRKKRDPVQKEHDEEGTSLAVFKHFNGECTESTIDA